MAQKQETATTEEVQQPTIPNLQIQALMGEMRRTMRAKLESIHERLDRVEAGTARGRQQNASNRQQGRRGPKEEVEDYYGDYGDGFEEEDEAFRLGGLLMVSVTRLIVFCSCFRRSVNGR